MKFLIWLFTTVILLLILIPLISNIMYKPVMYTLSFVAGFVSSSTGLYLAKLYDDRKQKTF